VLPNGYLLNRVPRNPHEGERGTSTFHQWCSDVRLVIGLIGDHTANDIHNAVHLPQSFYADIIHFYADIIHFCRPQQLHIANIHSVLHPQPFSSLDAGQATLNPKP